MRKQVIWTALFILLASGAAVSAPSLAKAKTEAVTITLPEEVIRKSLEDILPLNVEEKRYLEGTLVVDSISKLVMGENSAVLQGVLLGKNLTVVTRVGNQDLKIKVGDLVLPLTCDLFFRFDSPGKILYVTPRLRQPAAGSVTDMAGSVASVLTLFNDREYPVSLDSLKTLNARVGDQDISVDMEPVDIKVSRGQLVVRMVPRLSKTH